MFNEAIHFSRLVTGARAGPVFELQDVSVAGTRLDVVLRAGELLRVQGSDALARLGVLALAAGFVHAGQGTCRILGQDLRGRDRATREAFCREHIGRQLSFELLTPELSVLATLAEPLLELQVEPLVAEALAHDQLVRLAGAEAADWAQQRCGTLSAPQDQVLRCARALVARPPLLVLDYPEHKLGDAARSRLRQEVGRACRLHGCAVVVATNDPELAALAENTLVLETDPRRP